MKKLSFLTLALLALFLTSCQELPTGTGDDGGAEASTIELDLSGLETLGEDFVYEGWLIVDGKPVSTGTFSSVDFPQTFPVDEAVIAQASKFVLSIEPANDTDPAPSKTKLLAGDFDGDKASVTTKALFGDAFEGTFLLGTPTDSTRDTELSGVWFTGIKNFPTLPEGWKYEGWVMFDGKPLTTGTFTAFNTPDDNAETSTYNGPKASPNFAGEDFLNGEFNGVKFPTNLQGHTVIISVEPYPDNSAAPFTFKPVLGNIPADVSDHVAIPFVDGPVKEITGSVKR